MNLKGIYKAHGWECVINTTLNLMYVKKGRGALHCVVRPDEDGIYRPQFPCDMGRFIGHLDGTCYWEVQIKQSLTAED
tara:strand:+ start:289 stop:522 length:234 start_codon:yes stop_codon:yes gene_type:complete